MTQRLNAPIAFTRPSPCRQRFAGQPGTNLPLVSVLSVLAFASACQVDDAEEYRNAIPTRDTVTMRVPASAQSAESDTRQTFALVGETAEFYRLTRDVSRTINGSVYVVLALVRDVVRHPATEVTENSATWGPWTDALSPTTFMVTVTRVSEGEYRYVFKGKPRGSADSAYVTVLSGTHRMAGSERKTSARFGEGNFLIDWEAAATLPEHGRERGTAMISYSRRGPNTPVKVLGQFRQVNDEDAPGRLVDADYAYSENPDQSGAMEFTFNPAAMVVNGPARFSISSRWLATGAGRADVRATGGSLGASEATANECWDALFLSTYRSLSWDATGGWGAASSCVFSEAA